MAVVVARPGGADRPAKRARVLAAEGSSHHHHHHHHHHGHHRAEHHGCVESPVAATEPVIPELPDGVIHEILSRSCQETKATCMAVSKAWNKLARHRSLWRTVVIRHADAGALRRIVYGRPETVVFRTRSPDDVAWLLGEVGVCHIPLAARELRALDVRLGAVSRVPHALLTNACRLRCLTSLSITVDVSRGTSELVFPRSTTNLPALRELRVRERRGHEDGLKGVAVLFENLPPNALPALESVDLDVESSDVLACPRVAPALRRIVYRADAELYDDVDMRDRDLDLLDITLHPEANAREVYDNLALMRRAGTVVLRSSTDLYVDTPIPAEHLELHLLETETVAQLDFLTLRDELPTLKTLKVACDPALAAAAKGRRHRWTFRVFNVTSLADWVRVATRVDIDVDDSVLVQVVPISLPS